MDGINNAYCNPLAGWYDTTAATAELVKESVARGVNYVIVTGDVRKLELSKDRFKGVYTGDGKLYTADKVLLATGAWTSNIKTSTEDALGLWEQGRVESQIPAAAVCVAHYNLSPQEVSQLSRMPVVIQGNRMTASLRRQVIC